MNEVVLVAVYIAALGIGWLIGAVGIGGVLLVPVLVLIGGLDVATATPVASLSFLFTGIAGTIVHLRPVGATRRVVTWLTIGAVPGAVAGAATNVALSETVITIVIAVVLIGAATRYVLHSGEGSTFGARTYLLIGAVVGFGSALTGTGGPVLLIPILLLVGGAAAAAIAAAQPIQIPIALAATAGFLILGDLDWQLGVGLGLAQGVGAVVGARFSLIARAATLHRLVSAALLAAAVVFVGKALG